MTVGAIPITMRRPSAIAPTFSDAATAHLDAVHRYLTQMVRDVHLAEDLTAETFERAFRQWHTFDPRKGAALTWLITIARRIALDHFRSERRRHDREDRYSAMTPVAAEDRTPDLATFPPQMAAALDALSDVEREIVALRVLLDVDNVATAHLVGVSPSACSTHLHRAMTKLRKELGDD